tara:strand:+ start:564 stop:1181 length:618 start_codon:yes stop_codon:yes gene_type:complete
MNIAIIVEGQTESAFKKKLNEFLRTRLQGNMPRLDFVPYDGGGRLPKHNKLKTAVENLLNDAKRPADAVIALTDVYTGTNPPDFTSAADAKSKMRSWVGENAKFFPHAAANEFEGWLLPYWPRIQQLTGSNKAAPGPVPENVPHPAEKIQEIYRIGSKSKSYKKTVDAEKILRDQDLMVAINACPELKAFVNTIIGLCDETKVIP